MAADGPTRHRAGSLRFRLTAVATVAVATVLAATALALIQLQRWQLLENLDASLEQRSETIAGLVADDPSATPLVTDDDDRAVQLVDAGGTVLAASANLHGLPPLPNPLAETDRTEHLATRDDLPLDDNAYRVLTTAIKTAEGPAILHVAETTDDTNDAVRLLGTALAVSIPAIVAVLAGLMWWLTGRTLKPVEQIRTEVDAINDADSTQRLQAPKRDDEIGRLAHTMNRMLDRLQDAADRQRRFVGDAAHELRTPLTRIRTNLDVDLGQPENADLTATAHEVRQETIGLQRLIDDLLHLARSDAGQTSRHRQAVDLDDIVMQEIREQRDVTPAITIDAQGVSAASLAANPEHLARAVRNLLANAAQHADTTVAVELREARQHLVLAVADDGPGVPVDDRDRIFARFARVDDARTRSDGGTGLGLAITKDIVNAHGGTIHYDSDYTEGARFVILIPLSH